MNTTKRSTRRNHVGMFTATVILESGRIYGHGATREAASIAADNIIAALEAWRAEQAQRAAQKEIKS